MVEHGETERRHRQLVAEVRLTTVVTGWGTCGLPVVSTDIPCINSRIFPSRSGCPSRSYSVDEHLRATYSKLFVVAESERASLGHINASSAVVGVPDRPRASTAVHLIDGGDHGPPGTHVRIHGGGRTFPSRGPLLPAKRGCPGLAPPPRRTAPTRRRRPSRSPSPTSSPTRGSSRASSDQVGLHPSPSDAGREGAYPVGGIDETTLVRLANPRWSEWRLRLA